VTDAARAHLLQEYEPLMKERLDLGSHAGVLPRAKEPVYRWVRFKEAYSPRLVRDMLDELLPKPSSRRDDETSVVYDPMVGSGTSLLVAAERGLPALGADLMPYATFLSSTLVRSSQADPETVRQIAEDVLSGYASMPGRAVLDVPAAKWAFAPAVARTLTKLLNGVNRAPAGVDRDLVRLALLSAVEQVSYAVKDGTSLRRRLPDGPARPGRPGQQRRAMAAADVVAEVRRRLDEIIDDLEQIRSTSARAPVSDSVFFNQGEVLPTPTPTGAAGARMAPLAVVHADTRHWRPACGSCGVVIFSPPYPNRYDYSAIYQLELALGQFIPDAVGLRHLRKQLLRSHLEAPPRAEYHIELPALREFLAAINGSRENGDQSGRILRMVAGFFEDMADVLVRVAEAVRPGGSVGMVVGTQTYLGQHLPTDLLLGELGRSVGLEVRELWVVRAKGVASQQRHRLASSLSRETVLVLRKPSRPSAWPDDRGLREPTGSPAAPLYVESPLRWRGDHRRPGSLGPAHG
jgi:site-specific DNA-methyltransferase (adenine-specific)